MKQDQAKKNNSIIFKNLGLINYEDSLENMKLLINSSDFREEIWFLEHLPVYTLGSAAKKEHILRKTEIPVIQSDRGGEVTYHGPGQLVIYFMLNIKQRNLSPRKFVTHLQKMISLILHNHKIKSHIIDGAPGVYVDNKKIASIGLRFSKGKTYHGLSLNIDMNLEPFTNINPCGYQGLKTVNMTDLTMNVDVDEIKAIVKEYSENMVL